MLSRIAAASLIARRRGSEAVEIFRWMCATPLPVDIPAGLSCPPRCLRRPCGRSLNVRRARPPAAICRPGGSTPSPARGSKRSGRCWRREWANCRRARAASTRFFRPISKSRIAHAALPSVKQLYRAIGVAREDRPGALPPIRQELSVFRRTGRLVLRHRSHHATGAMGRSWRLHPDRHGACARLWARDLSARSLDHLAAHHARLPRLARRI